jgi:hypothetical protein
MIAPASGTAVSRKDKPRGTCRRSPSGQPRIRRASHRGPAGSRAKRRCGPGTEVSNARADAFDTARPVGTKHDRSSQPEPEARASDFDLSRFCDLGMDPHKDLARSGRRWPEVCGLQDLQAAKRVSDCRPDRQAPFLWGGAAPGRIPRLTDCPRGGEARAALTGQALLSLRFLGPRVAYDGF